MKIRSRLFLSFLPTFIAGIASLFFLLCYQKNREIEQRFQDRIHSALDISLAAITQEKALEKIWSEFGSYRVVALNSENQEIANLSGKEELTFPLHYEISSSAGKVLASVQPPSFQAELSEYILRITLGALFLIAITSALLYFISGKISQAARTLTNSSLAIAAGQYGQSIQIEGPQELKELANTLNTMSECLLENIHRLKEISILKERAHGEIECARLLQDLMLRKNIEECPHPIIAVKAITIPSPSPRGLLLDFPPLDSQTGFSIHLVEASEKGFSGMYQLLTQYQLFKDSAFHHLPSLCCRLIFQAELSLLTAKIKGMSHPFLWSLNKKCLFDLTESRVVEAGDLIFLYNQGLTQFFKGQKRIAELLEKVLKYFAHDGLDTCTAILQKEIAFATKRKELKEDIHLICFQILS